MRIYMGSRLGMLSQLAIASLVAAAMFASPWAVLAQDSVASLSPEFNRKLESASAAATPGAFVDAVRPLAVQAEQGFSEQTKQMAMEEIAAAAKSVLLRESAVLAADGDSLWQLATWAKSSLSADERTQVDALVAAKASASSVAELGRQLDVRGLLMGDTFQAIESRRSDAAERLREIGPENIRGVDVLAAFQHLAPWGRAGSGFHVEWRGQVAAPRDGEYVFSVSPLNISTEFTGAHHRQTAVVTLNGQEIIRATPGDWAYESKPVVLKEGQPVPLVMAFEYDCQDVHTRVTPGILRWKGPGVATQVVPASAFTLPSGDPGIEMTASWNARFAEDAPAGRSMQSTNIVDNIDTCFFDRVVDSDLELVARIAKNQLSYMASDEFISSLATQEAPGWPITQEPHWILRGSLHPQNRMLEVCSSADRKNLLNALLRAPQVIEGAWLNGVIDAYNLLRVGAEREAIDLLGVWMQAHANEVPQTASDSGDYFGKNRWNYRRLTIALAWEHPESLGWLKDDYLETEDGCCCLPVAYTVAYGHLVQGKILQWIDELDQRLSDRSRTGDKRVNWLIARAMAEEIRTRFGSRHQLKAEQLLAGLPYLEEAMLIAEGEEVQDRIAIEQATRFAASGLWTRARVAARNASRSSAALLTDIEAMQQAADQRLESQKLLARKELVEELLRRKNLAESRGDSSATDRLNKSLEKVNQERRQ